MLAAHGYGVLLLDMRGRGESEGDPNAFGWGATKDVAAGVAYLRARPDVKDGRIGGLGLSVGGEQLLEAAAEGVDVRAVVSEGAGSRSIREDLTRGPAGWPSLPTAAILTGATAVFSWDVPPPSLEELVARISPVPILLVYAGNGQGGEDLNPTYFDAADEPKTLWEIPEAGHTGGLETRPDEYEQRVVAFFDQALLQD
jgi:dienelactone hydrolase